MIKSFTRILRGMSASTPTAEELVTELYRGLLEREPDAGGLRGNVAAMRAGAPLAEIAKGVASSDEFVKKSGLLRVPPSQLPDLSAEFPARYQRLEDGTCVLALEDDDGFDWIEGQIGEHRYYDSFGVWSPTIDLDKQVIASTVAGLGARNCLEIGCFTGTVLSLLHERGIDVTGIDLSHLAFVLAYPSIRSRIRFGDLLSLDLKGPFDVVLAMDILEHLNPTRLDRYLERIVSLLDQEGYLLLNSPMFGTDDVFGEVAPPHLPQWRSAGPSVYWRHLHCDALGWPLHGHLIWASPSWWENRLEANGLVRDREVERRMHAVLGGFFAGYAPARKSFFVLRRADARTPPGTRADAVVRELASLLSPYPEFAA
ncbi:methyltransferase domain-containing protein [Dokdonella sp.]|uniref:methyltransferase domain-containing protein n=1 Tax=Dokdonella sp. TaxID=2291710 RepID=UPI003784D83A